MEMVPCLESLTPSRSMYIDGGSLGRPLRESISADNTGRVSTRTQADGFSLLTSLLLR